MKLTEREQALSDTHRDTLLAQLKTVIVHSRNCTCDPACNGAAIIFKDDYPNIYAKAEEEVIQAEKQDKDITISDTDDAQTETVTEGLYDGILSQFDEMDRRRERLHRGG